MPIGGTLCRNVRRSLPPWTNCSSDLQFKIKWYLGNKVHCSGNRLVCFKPLLPVSKSYLRQRGGGVLGLLFLDGLNPSFLLLDGSNADFGLCESIDDISVGGNEVDGESVTPC